nr:ExeM/NucH family extracellular endonuclease [Alteromonas sp. BMJM2]
MQEENADSDGDTTTSEAIIVEGETDITVGNVIRLYGSVTENFGMTTIEMDSDVVAADCGASDDVVTTSISMPYEEDLEAFEGMLVSVTNATVTSTNSLWRFGEIVVSNGVKRQPSDIAPPLSDAFAAAQTESEASLLTIEDNSGSQYPDAISFFPNFSYANTIRIGDTVSASGPLNFSFGTYRINPTEVIAVTSTREDTPVVSEGNLSVATFNVLNYFNGDEDENGELTFDYDDNRGAESETAFALQESRIVEAIIVEAIVDLNADVVGLMEIENDGFGDDSAIQSLLNAINAQLGEAEQYAFISTADNSQIGTDAITVGLLYRGTVETPQGDAVIVAMPEQQVSEDRLARMGPSLVRTFEHTESGETFAVAVNHFKSKGSQCAEDVAEAPSDIDTIQGSCNALRVSAAITLGNALNDETLPERKIILGDLNAYSAEDPVAVLTDYTQENRGYTIKTAINTGMDEGEAVEVDTNFGYHNLAETFDEDGFSYWFFGTEQVGSLDHVLASDAILADAVDGTHWNINSVEAYQLQYNQALRFYPDEEGYAFTDIGPVRSSDHDPFIATFNLVADEPAALPIPNEDEDSSGGSMGGILTLLAAMVGFRRWSAVSKNSASKKRAS